LDCRLAPIWRELSALTQRTSVSRSEVADLQSLVAKLDEQLNTNKNRIGALGDQLNMRMEWSAPRSELTALQGRVSALDDQLHANRNRIGAFGEKLNVNKEWSTLPSKVAVLQFQLAALSEQFVASKEGMAANMEGMTALSGKMSQVVNLQASARASLENEFKVWASGMRESQASLRAFVERALHQAAAKGDEQMERLAQRVTSLRSSSHEHDTLQHR